MPAIMAEKYKALVDYNKCNWTDTYTGWNSESFSFSARNEMLRFDKMPYFSFDFYPFLILITCFLYFTIFYLFNIYNVFFRHTTLDTIKQIFYGCLVYLLIFSIFLTPKLDNSLLTKFNNLSEIDRFLIFIYFSFILNPIAQSVCLPERFTPSVRFNLLSRVNMFKVLLPESFRGGCSFGATQCSLSLKNILNCIMLAYNNLIKYLNILSPFFDIN